MLLYRASGYNMGRPEIKHMELDDPDLVARIKLTASRGYSHRQCPHDYWLSGLLPHVAQETGKGYLTGKTNSVKMINPYQMLLINQEPPSLPQHTSETGLGTWVAGHCMVL